MLLDAETLDLAPRAREVVAALGGDPRFKLEMPAAQLEIVTAPHATVARRGRRARRRRARARRGGRRPLPRSRAPARTRSRPGYGPLNPGPRYEAIGAEYASVARRQLVFGLHVHVAIRGADRALAVYNALRSYLPELAALAANAPFYEGRDSGLASVRSRICGPAAAPGRPARARRASRPTPRRCAGAASTTRASGGGSCACTRCSARSRSACRTRRRRSPTPRRSATSCTRSSRASPTRHDAGERCRSPSRGGSTRTAGRPAATALDGEMTDLETGERAPTRERLARVLGAPPPGSTAPARQREVAAERGLRGLVGVAGGRASRRVGLGA